MREGNIFSLFTLVGGGLPHPAGGGYPIPGLNWGYPILLMGGTPSKISMGGEYPRVPPTQDWMGYPPLSRTGWATSPHPDLGWGTPPVQDWMYPLPPPVRRQISIESTCYVAGGMPLAFTQEDFLVQVSTTQDSFSFHRC